MHHTPLHTGKTSVREQISEAHCDGIELADGEGERKKKLGVKKLEELKNVVKFEDKGQLFRQDPALRRGCAAHRPEPKHLGNLLLLR
jgi:hypothetical protein